METVVFRIRRFLEQPELHQVSVFPFLDSILVKGNILKLNQIGCFITSTLVIYTMKLFTYLHTKHHTWFISTNNGAVARTFVTEMVEIVKNVWDQDEPRKQQEALLENSKHSMPLPLYDRSKIATDWSDGCTCGRYNECIDSTRGPEDINSLCVACRCILAEIEIDTEAQMLEKRKKIGEHANTELYLIENLELRLERILAGGSDECNRSEKSAKHKKMDQGIETTGRPHVFGGIVQAKDDVELEFLSKETLEAFIALIENSVEAFKTVLHGETKESSKDFLENRRTLLHGRKSLGEKGFISPSTYRNTRAVLEDELRIQTLLQERKRTSDDNGKSGNMRNSEAIRTQLKNLIKKHDQYGIKVPEEAVPYTPSRKTFFEEITSGNTKQTCQTKEETGRSIKSRLSEENESCTAVDVIGYDPEYGPIPIFGTSGESEDTGGSHADIQFGMEESSCKPSIRLQCSLISPNARESNPDIHDDTEDSFCQSSIPEESNQDCQSDDTLNITEVYTQRIIKDGNSLFRAVAELHPDLSQDRHAELRLWTYEYCKQRRLELNITAQVLDEIGALNHRVDREVAIPAMANILQTKIIVCHNVTPQVGLQQTFTPTDGTFTTTIYLLLDKLTNHYDALVQKRTFEGILLNIEEVEQGVCDYAWKQHSRPFAEYLQEISADARKIDPDMHDDTEDSFCKSLVTEESNQISANTRKSNRVMHDGTKNSFSKPSIVEESNQGSKNPGQLNQDMHDNAVDSCCQPLTFEESQQDCQSDDIPSITMMNTHKIIGDGNSLFRAVAELHPDLTQDSHAELRQLTYEYCKENCLELNATTRVLEEIGTINHTVDGEIAILALANILQTKIIVRYHETPQLGWHQVFTPTDGIYTATIYLRLDMPTNHYDALVYDNDMATM